MANTSIGYDKATKQTKWKNNEPVFVKDNNGKFFIVDPSTKTRHPVTGPGAMQAARDLYGSPVQNVYLTRYNRGENAVDLFGGPNQMERVVAGLKVDPITGDYKQNPRSITTGSGVLVEPRVATNYRDEIRRLQPGLPSALVEIYAKAWSETGSPDLALAEMRADQKYERYFPGNKRDDGTIRLSEQEYKSTIESYQRELGSYGLPAKEFNHRMVDLIKGEVSPQEFNQRLSNAYTGIVANHEAVKSYYAKNYGANVSTSSIFASAISPGINPLVFEQRIRNSQIGAEASLAGFNLDLLEADRYRSFGLDQEAARKFFAQASNDIPRFGDLVKRHNDPDDTFSLDEYSDALILNNADQLDRIRRLVAGEVSTFATRNTFATDRAGTLRGLQRG